MRRTLMLRFHTIHTLLLRALLDSPLGQYQQDLSTPPPPNPLRLTTTGAAPALSGPIDDHLSVAVGDPFHEGGRGTPQEGEGAGGRGPDSSNGGVRMQPPLTQAETTRLTAACTGAVLRAEVLRQFREAADRAGLAGFERVHAGDCFEATFFPWPISNATAQDHFAHGFLPMPVFPAVRIVPEEWTPTDGLLTPTHKLVRHHLRAKFAAEVEDMMKAWE